MFFLSVYLKIILQIIFYSHLLKKGAVIHNETFYCEKCYNFKIANICCVCK